MFPAIVTSSGVDAFDACIGTVVLPRVRGERSAAVDAGTGEHAERLRLGGLPDKVLAWFGGKEPAYEVAMAADTALDAAGGRASASLGRYLDRGYPLFPTPTWLAGTADMVRVDGDVVSVADLKTGRGQSRGALPPPEEAGQLLSLAWLTSVLAAARRPGWRPRRVRLAWWYTSERPDDVEDSEIEADRLFVWADRFCARVAQARAFGALQLQRGPQCQGCAAFDACPAQGGAIRRVAELSGTPEPDGALSPEYLAAAWNDLVAAERITAAAREAIARFVDGNAHRLQAWLDQVADGVQNDEGEYIVKPDPEKAYSLFQSVIEYHVHKLARTEHTGKDGGAIIVQGARHDDDI